jgi:hypothetical protein
VKKTRPGLEARAGLGGRLETQLEVDDVEDPSQTDSEVRRRPTERPSHSGIMCCSVLNPTGLYNQP